MDILSIYQPFMSAVLSVHNGQYSIPANDIAEYLDTYRDKADKEAKKLFSRDDFFDDAKFAIYTWADEKLLLSDWSKSHPWIPLQARFFNTHCGGEEFFSRLDNILSRFDATNDSPTETYSKQAIKNVLHVYARCLTMGVEGKYFESDKKELLSIKQTVITALAPDNEGALFNTASAAEKSQPLIQWRWLDFFILMLILSSIFGSALIFILYQVLLFNLV
ncbi:DotU family type IV/VI secretion system protein [Shewanella surugensis]|uniref:DotU family type IV/VI secretion system protein n=1 Tax=Shewanella surugensis TaxID=212020 RepID=A0ABT0LG55_9GAMM|nr:DotU family type IV/VI secretion system protein [Shewanella surugensis]MCL1126465.1 DotU family type IV/VI secretion system protein [Shewanella surugensis]